jgi:hypothetical protein
VTRRDSVNRTRERPSRVSFFTCPGGSLSAFLVAGHDVTGIAS